MKTVLQRTSTAVVLLTAVGLMSRCSDSGSGSSGGSGQSVTITAPVVVSPNAPSPIATSQPTLTVQNASVSDGSTPTYEFQVGTDQAFASIIVQVTGIAQGSGQTSWQVSQPLGDGTYFWRSRATASGTSGPYSGVGQFAILGTTGGGQNVIVFDALTDGTTIATTTGGGSFVPGQGWRVDNTSDFLRYEVPAISDGSVEWQNVGLTPRGATVDSHMLFGMYDPTAGGFRANPFRVNIQKLWNNPHNPPFVRLRFISQGRLQDDGTNKTDWDPGTVYTWRIEWGPGGGANTAKVFLDGMEIMQVRYNRAYTPNVHYIEFGPSERNESVVDAIYRNIAITRNN